MSGVIIKDENNHVNETFEKGILRKVVRESWRGKIAESTTNPRAAQILDEHASKMEDLFGTLEYGALCMPNIIANSKKMSERELTAYLTILESLGAGYKSNFNSDFANIILAGLILKARDQYSVLKHLNVFTGGIEKKLSSYKSAMEMENKDLSTLMEELEAKDSGLFRFFRKGEIRLLKRLIAMKSKRLKVLQKRSGRYSGIMMKVKIQKKS